MFGKVWKNLLLWGGFWDSEVEVGKMIYIMLGIIIIFNKLLF